MPTFVYKARNEIGKAVEGVMEAMSEDELMSRLKKLSYMPVSVKETTKNAKIEGSSGSYMFQRIKAEDLVVFNMQLAGMIGAGISLLSALNIISKQIINQKFKGVINEIKKAVAAGSSFSEALSQHTQVFTPLYINMIKAGETGGALNTVLNRLAKYQEDEEELKRSIKGALFYPAILLALGLVVILLVVTYVIPKFIVIFERANIVLPLPTVILYVFGMSIKKFWYLIILSFVGSGFLIKNYARSNRGRYRLDYLKLKTPMIGALIRKIIISRFTRTLATLIESGVPMLHSLEIMKDVVGNEVFKKVVIQIRLSVERGERLDQPLKMSGEFPDDVVYMISVGEETGKLGVMLGKTADFYDSSIKYSIKKLTILIEPIFITLMGIIVGSIMASMLIPIFDMVKTINR